MAKSREAREQHLDAPLQLVVDHDPLTGNP